MIHDDTLGTASGRDKDDGAAIDAGPRSSGSPVDDRTYDLLQALTSKLEAIDAYEMYAQDDPSGLFVEFIADERRHAERLLTELRSSLAPR